MYDDGNGDDSRRVRRVRIPHMCTRKRRRRKKNDEKGKDMDGDDLFEKINIVPQLRLPSSTGAQKNPTSSYFFFLPPLSRRYVLCTR